MKFSVIIPVFNKATTIAESIDSVLAQTEKDYELIVVNDGSTDNIADVLANYESITVVNQENGGVSRARNAGIEVANGEYICFLDADDLWLPNHLEQMSILIQKFPDAGMYVTSHIETTEDGKVSHSGVHLRGFDNCFLSENLFALLNRKAYNLIHTNSMCIPKNVLVCDNIWFEPGEKIGEDTDVWYRVALGYPVALSKSETTVYRKENSTATKKGTSSFTWIFARRWEMLAEQGYSSARKKECAKLIKRYRLSCSREYILMRDRRNAIKQLKQSRHFSKQYFLTLILAVLPYAWSRYLITSYK